MLLPTEESYHRHYCTSIQYTTAPASATHRTDDASENFGSGATFRASNRNYATHKPAKLL